MGFFSSFNDSLHLVKLTFTVIGKQRAIIKPTFTQMWIGIILYLLLLLSGVGLFFVGAYAYYAFIVVLLIIMFIFPFIKMHYKAAQCWIVYKTFTGGQTSYSDGLARAKKNKGDIFWLGLADIIMNFLARQLKNRRGGLLAILFWLLGKAVEEIWDLVGHYLLPASIIRDKTLKEAIPEIKNLKNNIPGALAGVFGFDFVGDAIRGYLTGFFFIIGLLGAVLGFFGKSWIPVVVIFLVIVGINILAKIFIEMIKTIYFTLFFVSVAMPMSIPEEQRKEVTNYLTYNVEKSKDTPEQQVEKLIPYIQKYRRQKYSDEKIVGFLVKNGWQKEVVQKALKKK